MEITTRDVAEFLGVRSATVRRWVARGHITPIRKIGPSNVFNSRDVLNAYDEIQARRRATNRPDQRRDHWLAEYRAMDHVPAKHWDDLVGIESAAELVGVSAATIRSWSTVVTSIRPRHQNPAPCDFDSAT